MIADVDVAIVGSGFGGSLLGMIATRLGLRVALLERGRHPRFAIGESASPLAGVLIEQLADRYDLPRVRPLATYGRWRRQYPDVTCGLKRGFTYFKHAVGQRYAGVRDRSNQLLVAASPCDEVSDTHWLRADVDHFLVREAEALGVDYRDGVSLDAVDWQPNGDAVLCGTWRSRPLRLRATHVIDGTGPGGFLSRALNIAPTVFGGYPDTQALYSHFTGVRACAEMDEYATADEPPYPIDAAALHHVFDDGWMWVLRFDNGVTSAGIAVTARLASELRLADGTPAWQRFLARYPSIAAQFADATPIREFTWMPRVAYRASRAAGARWAMLPSAAAFVDPLFSTGIPLTLLGVERIAAALQGRPDGQPLHGRQGRPEGRPLHGLHEPALHRSAHDGSGRPSGRPFDAYGDITLAEADHTARFVGRCYEAFPRFQEFVDRSMFYFVAASFSEMSRRLGQPGRGFLCAADAEFADAMTRPMGQDRPCNSHVLARLNVAGLCDTEKRNWYGVDLEDTVRGAARLGVTANDVRAMLAFTLPATG